MRQNSDAWQEIHDTLEDEISRRTLVDVLLFLLTADPSYMRSYSVRIHDQYFEEFMQYQKEIFVDAGAFDGDTTEEFANRYPDFKKYYFSSHPRTTWSSPAGDLQTCAT